MIRGVKFASIPVTDQDQALAFYTEKLGFRLLADQPFNEKQRWIELGIAGTETRVVLFRFDDGLLPGTKMNITFWTDDVERTVRELESKGVEFVMKPQKADWGTAAIFKDIDGNTFVNQHDMGRTLFNLQRRKTHNEVQDPKLHLPVIERDLFDVLDSAHS
jgi:catechol 2,3-dioxygenase-like lactoylglutathione lyase family enzyme